MIINLLPDYKSDKIIAEVIQPIPDYIQIAFRTVDFFKRTQSLEFVAVDNFEQVCSVDLIFHVFILSLSVSYSRFVFQIAPYHQPIAQVNRF